MIYKQKHVFFVALAGLFTSASAAPIHHAKSGHTSELISPGLTEPEKMWTRGVTKEDYPEACMAAWDFFNKDKCWCFTGCALDCNHGGWKVDPRRGKPADPGVPGKDLNPEMCEGLTDDDKKACEVPTCDLVDNCNDVADNLKPGLDKIESTGNYDCAALAPLKACQTDAHADWFYRPGYLFLQMEQKAFDAKYTKQEFLAKKFNVYVDDTQIVSDAAISGSGYEMTMKHSGIEIYEYYFRKPTIPADDSWYPFDKTNVYVTSLYGEDAACRLRLEEA